MKISIRLANRSDFLLSALLLTLSGSIEASTLIYRSISGLVINDNAVATPYPSNIFVIDEPLGKVISVRVKIEGFTHPWPQDVDIFIRGPNAGYAAVMSDAGLSASVSDIDLEFDDNADSVIPNSALVSGTYRPFDYDPVSDIDVNPPNVLVRLDNLIDLTNEGVVGTWGLYVSDDELQLDGSIASWSLIIETLPGPLVTARDSHTSTLMPDGKVLVTGGYGSSGFLASAELYDPVAGTWTATGTMQTARAEHTATLLSNGKVLVAGGYNGVSIAGSEVYDPVSGSWSTASPMGTARSEHTATQLPNGMLLITGGLAAVGFNSLNTSELFDPASGSWSPIGDLLSTKRSNHSATLMANGTVLVVGGYDTAILQPVSGAEFFNPATGQWNPATGAMGTARQGHTATLMPNGKVLIAAGGNNISGALSSAEEFDPVAGTFSATSSLGTSRQFHSASLLPDGRVLVAGDGVGDKSDTEIYDPSSRTWSPHTSILNRARHTSTVLPGGQVLLVGGSRNGYLDNTELVAEAFSSGWDSTTQNLLGARYNHSATTMPNGKVLVAGGYNSDYLSTAEEYDPVTDSLSFTDSLNLAREQHTATLLQNGQVLVAGGNGFGSVKSAELYDPNSRTWATTGALNAGRYKHTATLLPGGQVLVVGGGSGPNVTGGSELFDPDTGLWSPTASLNTPRQLHTATLLHDGRVLVTGGTNNPEDISFDSTEIFDPAGNAGAGSWTAVSPLGTPRHEHTATLLPNGQVLVVAGLSRVLGSTSETLASAEIFDPVLNSWRAVTPLATERRLHTATLLPNGLVLIAGGAIASELYDPGRQAWLSAGDEPFFNKQTTATLLQDGKVWVAGGSTFGTSGTDEALLFVIDPVALPEWQPAITSATINDLNRLELTGTGFTGISEASGGNGSQQSSSAFPVVQWRYLNNDLSVYLQPEASSSFSATGFVSRSLKVNPGYGMVTVFTNGIHSTSFIALFDGVQINLPPLMFGSGFED